MALEQRKPQAQPGNQEPGKPQNQESAWNMFVTKAFTKAGMPEVEEVDLEAGTYTNAQIAERFRDEPFRLLSLLMDLPQNDDPVMKRSILSFAVDMIEDDQKPTT